MKKTHSLILVAALAILCAAALTGCGCMETPASSASSTPSPAHTPVASPLPDSMAGSMAPSMSALPEQSGSMAGSAVTDMAGSSGSGSAMR